MFVTSMHIGKSFVAYLDKCMFLNSSRNAEALFHAQTITM